MSVICRWRGSLHGRSEGAAGERQNVEIFGCAGDAAPVWVLQCLSLRCESKFDVVPPALYLKWPSQRMQTATDLPSTVLSEKCCHTSDLRSRREAGEGSFGDLSKLSHSVSLLLVLDTFARLATGSVDSMLTPKSRNF